MPPRVRIFTHSSEETLQAGREFATSLKGNEVVAFFGDLGVGKTTFLKGMINTLTGCSVDEITSPTFNYLHVYPAVFHFDLYRLKSAEQFESAGFSEYFGKGICCIEWAERIADRLPQGVMRVVMEHRGNDEREISYG